METKHTDGTMDVRQLNAFSSQKSTFQQSQSDLIQFSERFRAK